ncbi:MAG: PEGA domain-containing protein [Candidatus Falkowbacteria bacterium]
MSLNQRRALYIFFILVFLTATPLISLYAIGYKIGSGFSFRKTGMLILDTEPKGAKIYLDGRIRQNFFKRIYAEDQSYVRTPAKIKNLLPGTYDVLVELPGYWPWQKKLTVNPGQSTFAEDISLFRKNMPELLESGAFIETAVSPGGRNLLTAESSDDKTTFSLIDLENGNKEDFIASGSDNTVNGLWSPNGERVIAGGFIFRVDDWDSPIALDRLIGHNIRNVRWDAINGNRVFYENDEGIHYYDLSDNREKTALVRSDPGDYLPKGDHLYFIKRETGSTRLLIRRLSDDQPAGEINLPNSSYSFLNTERDIINLYDNLSGTLYLIDPFSAYKPLVETLRNIKVAHWVNDNTLLCANDFEIWIFNPKNGRKILLTRISEPLSEVIWHPNNNNIIYVTEKSVNVIEMDDREKYNITKLIELEKIERPILNKKGDILYFSAKIGNQEGVYKLYLQ